MRIRWSFCSIASLASLLGACASGPAPPLVREAADVEPLSLLRASCSHPVELARDCSSWSGAQRDVVIEGAETRIAGSEDGRHVMVMVPDPMALVRGGPGRLTDETNRRVDRVRSFLAGHGIAVVRATPLLAAGPSVGAYLLELDGAGYDLLAAATGPPSLAAPHPPDVLVNVRDADGTVGFLHFRPEDMPITVDLGRPRSPFALASTSEALEALADGFRAWEDALAARAPWVAFEWVEDHPSPDVRFDWSLDRRAKGHYRREPVLDPPTPKARAEIPMGFGQRVDTLYQIGLYAAGFALGLGAREDGESVMDGAWLFRQPRPRDQRPTERDVDRFCALQAEPTGLRIDGLPLRVLLDAGWTPPAQDVLTAPCVGGDGSNR